LEKILNDEEKIRKAEEIYFRRNNQTYQTNKKEKGKTKNIKYKLLFNVLIMFNLAVIVFFVQNKDFIFTNEFIEKISEYNSNATGKILEVFAFILSDKENDNMQNQINENTIIEESQTIMENPNVNIENNYENSVSSINEMEMDIKNLKAAYKFCNPLKGTVSSGFGARESKYQNVTGYHTGVDIAADLGTPIVASMEGIVELVSSEGDYGKHVKIRCNNIYTLYAHCSKIFVKEGQIVARGQKIANVGNTGNSTGPHLHFEVRVEDRFVDPTKIINF
jgi:murein DD-endopeptidase MepM/ murein hydrolase activator NlpD